MNSNNVNLRNISPALVILRNLTLIIGVGRSGDELFSISACRPAVASRSCLSYGLCYNRYGYICNNNILDCWMFWKWRENFEISPASGWASSRRVISSELLIVPSLSLSLVLFLLPREHCHKIGPAYVLAVYFTFVERSFVYSPKFTRWGRGISRPSEHRAPVRFVSAARASDFRFLPLPCELAFGLIRLIRRIRAA